MTNFSARFIWRIKEYFNQAFVKHRITPVELATTCATTTLCAGLTAVGIVGILTCTGVLPGLLPYLAVSKTTGLITSAIAGIGGALGTKFFAGEFLSTFAGLKRYVDFAEEVAMRRQNDFAAYQEKQQRQPPPVQWRPVTKPGTHATGPACPAENFTAASKTGIRKGNKKTQGPKQQKPRFKLKK